MTIEFHPGDKVVRNDRAVDPMHGRVGVVLAFYEDQLLVWYPGNFATVIEELAAKFTIAHI